MKKSYVLLCSGLSIIWFLGLCIFSITTLKSVLSSIIPCLFMGTIGIALIFFYFIPFGIAQKRECKSIVTISFLNLILGWTLIGWVIAFVWARNGIVKPRPKFIPKGACAECRKQIGRKETIVFGDTVVCVNCKEKYTQKIKEGIA